MKLEEQLQKYRVAGPPPALETRILANVRSELETDNIPRWMKSPAWAILFVAFLTLGVLCFSQTEGNTATPQPGSLVEREKELPMELAFREKPKQQQSSDIHKPEAMVRPDNRRPKNRSYAA